MKRIFNFISENWNIITSVILGTVILFACAVLVSWLCGYWLNGLYGYHFELNSVLNGLGALITATVGGLTSAAMTIGKYYVDSKFNSKPGERIGHNDGISSKTEEQK